MGWSKQGEGCDAESLACVHPGVGKNIFPSLPQLLTIQEIMSVNEAQSWKHVFTFLNVQAL